MSTTCTRCDGAGFLNIDQVGDFVDGLDPDAVAQWIATHPEIDHDVTVCDCCGDGENWYGIPGEHYNPEDPPGPGGPYAYNGGLCRCH